MKRSDQRSRGETTGRSDVSSPCFFSLLFRFIKNHVDRATEDVKNIFYGYCVGV